MYTLASRMLALTIINTAEGYSDRCNAVKHNVSPTERARAFWRFASQGYRKDIKESGNPETEKLSARDILLCALELEEYYAEHVSEF